MTEFGKRQVNSVWVEAGANLVGSLIEQHAVDELIIYVAPKLLGDNARGLCQLSHLEKLADAPLWQLQECERIGDDLKLSYLPNLLIKNKKMLKNFSTPPFGGLLRQVLFYLPFLSSITAAFSLLMISFRSIAP